MVKRQNLILPPIDLSKRDLSLIYGVGKVLKEYCKLNLQPTGIYGEWVHGCTFPWHFHSPASLIGGNVNNKLSLNWVSNKADEEYLVSNGFFAKAIGLPICYLPEINVNRIHDSVLVMPAHSSYYVNSYDNKNGNSKEEYIRYLGNNLNHYNLKFASIHHECARRGLWINEFKNLNIKILQGANSQDYNALFRIKSMMLQFEYVTSNVLGSHIAYAAAFGAKVSINGPYQKWSRNAYLEEPFYKENPQLLDYLEQEEAVARDNYPFLFVEPSKSKSHIDWGKEMCGFANIKSPTELTSLLQVNTIDESFRRAFSYSKYLVKSIIPN
jgi:hypothetical protein